MKRKLLFGTAVVLAFTCLPVEGADATAGPCLHLSFDQEDDEVTLDSSGHKNYGTLVGPTWTAERHGGCYRFDGKDDFVDCGDADELNPGDGEFTVELWLKSTRKNVHQTLVHTGGQPTGGGMFALNLTAGNLLEATCRFRTAEGKACYAMRQSSPRPTDVNDGRWHHVAAVVRPGAPPRLFVDGVEDANGTAATRNAKAMVLRNGNPLYLGATSPVGRQCFEGLLDEVRMVRRALSAGEIAVNFQQQKAGRVTSAPALSPRSRVKQGGSTLLLHNNRIGMVFHAQYGLPQSVVFPPDGASLMQTSWRGSVAWFVKGCDAKGKELIRPWQHHNRCSTRVWGVQGTGFAEVRGEIVRGPTREEGLVKIEYVYRLGDGKPYIAVNYTVTALHPFTVASSALGFVFSGTHCVYTDPSGGGIKTTDASGWRNRLAWGKDVPLDDFWMASGRVGPAPCLAVVLPGRRSMRDMAFTANELSIPGPPSFRGAVKAGAKATVTFCLLGVDRAGKTGVEAERLAVAKMLREVGKD